MAHLLRQSGHGEVQGVCTQAPLALCVGNHGATVVLGRLNSEPIHIIISLVYAQIMRWAFASVAAATRSWCARPKRLGKANRVQTMYQGFTQTENFNIDLMMPN